MKVFHEIKETVNYEEIILVVIILNLIIIGFDFLLYMIWLQFELSLFILGFILGISHLYFTADIIRKVYNTKQTIIHTIK